MTARMNALVANAYSIQPFAELPLPYQLAIVQYLAVECGVWNEVALWHYSEAFLKSSLAELLPAFVEVHGEELFGTVRLGVSQLTEAVMEDEEISDSHASWDDYHAWYASCDDMPSYPSTERWPVFLSASDDETIRDGWHRLHSYVRDGAKVIPAVFIPTAQHVSSGGIKHSDTVREAAEQIIAKVEAAQERAEHLSAHNACKAAGVAFADYKAARLAVYGLNPGL